MKIIPFPLSHPPGARYNKANISNETIIKGIIDNDKDAVSAVYNEYYHKIKKMVYTFHNTGLDPDDIFQEGLTRAILNIREGKFRGESSFLTYLNGICRNLCLKEIYSRHMDPVDGKDFKSEVENDEFEVFEKILQVRERLDEKCRIIIDMRFGIVGYEISKEIAFEEIAAKLGISNDNARQRFKRFLDKLREYVKNDSERNDLLYS